MAPSSIQVSQETREALKKYKIEDMSYEDVLKIWMELMPPEEFHELYREWQARVAEEIRNSKEWAPLSG